MVSILKKGRVYSNIIAQTDFEISQTLIIIIPFFHHQKYEIYHIIFTIHKKSKKFLTKYLALHSTLLYLCFIIIHKGLIK